jgi:hypothetical protein
MIPIRYACLVESDHAASPMMVSEQKNSAMRFMPYELHLAAASSALLRRLRWQDMLVPIVHIDILRGRLKVQMQTQEAKVMKSQRGPNECDSCESRRRGYDDHRDHR